MLRILLRDRRKGDLVEAGIATDPTRLYPLFWKSVAFERRGWSGKRATGRILRTEDGGDAALTVDGGRGVVRSYKSVVGRSCDISIVVKGSGCPTTLGHLLAPVRLHYTAPGFLRPPASDVDKTVGNCSGGASVTRKHERGRSH